MFIFATLVFLTIAALGFWWLSAYDVKLTGENERNDFIRRAVRCGITLLLVGPAFWGLWRYWRYDDNAAGFLYVATILPLAIIWAGCLSELASHGFHWLIDPEDRGELASRKNRRDLDMLSSLLGTGRIEEAIQLCQMLKESGNISVVTLDTILERFGVKQDSPRKHKPLMEARRLRAEGRLTEAESILNSLLAVNPSDVEAAVLLMRLYAGDRHRTDQATEVLRALERQPHISPAHIEFARRSIEEWRHPRPAETAVEAKPESIDDLLAHGFFGTVIEMLEQKVREQPQNFEVWLKLAETHGQHCGNIRRAEKIIRQIETNPAFRPEQIELAKARLDGWRDKKSAK